MIIKKADELELNNSMQIVSRDHIAAKNRYVFFDNKIRPVSKFDDKLEWETTQSFSNHFFRHIAL